jgi:NAD(P)-dependent dehydrogenase (short-subunit alcohol dehydrogenase family)
MPAGARPGGLRRDDPGDWFYTLEWRRSAAPLDLPRARSERPILVLGSDSPVSASLVEALRAEGRPVLLALAGETCMRGGPGWFVVRPGEASDLEALIDTLRAEGRLPADVAHLWTLAPDDPAAGPAARFARARDRAFRSLLHLARALGRGSREIPACIHVISNGIQEVTAEGVLSPLAALLLGPCRVAPREIPGLRMRSLDLHLPDPERGLGPELGRRILAELVAEAPDEAVALRARQRLVTRYEPLRLGPRPHGPTWLRERGVYLVAGGLGGLGLTLSEHLARRVRARLVLVGRRGLPPRDTWGAWIAQRGEHDPTSCRIRGVQSLEGLGAEVTILAADVADPEAVRAAVGRALAQHGAIHGAFHVAGLRESSAGRETPDSTDRELSLKVLGALALEAALADAHPDFLLFYTSLAGAAGLPGQVDAAAADAFLAAFSCARSAAGRPTFAVGWGTWEQVGMAARRERALEAAAQTGPPVDHAWLGRRLGEIFGEEVFLGELSAEADGVLAEHRARGGGAFLPGAAFLELARVAHVAMAGEGPTEIRELRVLRRLALPEGQRRALRVRLARSGALLVESRGADAPDAPWLLHASGRAVRAAGAAPSRPLAEIRRRCGEHWLRLEGPLPFPHLALGPRFGCLRAVGYGDGEALAEVELPEAFAADLARHPLHPALVEMATSCGLPLVPDFNPVLDFYLPEAYGRVRVWQALPARFACHVRHRKLSDDEHGAVFDATLLDDEGRELAALEGIAFRRVEDPASWLRAAGEAAPDEGAELPASYLEQAIHVEEGLAALDRLLGHEPPAHLLVAPYPIAGWIEAVALVAQSETGAPSGTPEAERELRELAAGAR